MPASPDSDRKHRTIRSFVRRAGRLTASQQRAIDELWPVFGLSVDDSKLDLVEVFGRTAPRVVEIGFGNGDTLVEMAAAHPENDYLGIEVHEPGVGHCLIKIREAGITNLRLINHDAVDVLKSGIPDGSVNRINLYFPDPWPKKRHHKRRILKHDFLELCAAKLVPGGALHIATDWANYAEHIDELFADQPWFRLAERREHDGNDPIDRPQTKFERRGLRRGYRITDWRYVRTD